METMNFFLRLCFTAMMVSFAWITASAQVTIGSNNPPSEWSLLDLNEEPDGTSTRALHLPRLSNDERNALVTPDSVLDIKMPAQGLLIFNTDTRCLEFWNSGEWISLCDGDTFDPCPDFSTMDLFFYLGATIDNLSARAREAGGRGEIQWYASADGGDPLPGNTPLAVGATYWAGNCAGEEPRVPVPVLIEFSGVLPREVDGARITTFLNTMYDFQQQQLEAYHINEEITEWLWLVGSNEDDYRIAPGSSNSNFYVIPADIIHDYPANVEVLRFRCIMTTSEGAVASVRHYINFIRTTDGNGNFVGNYNMDENGVRYLVIERGYGGETRGGTIKLALLNLGASGKGSWVNGVHKPDDDFAATGIANDAGDLGDFFQWGRIADGHERVTWSKDRTDLLRPNAVSIPGYVVSTAALIGSESNQTTLDGQIPNDGAAGFGIFITSAGNWNPNSRGNDLWGNLGRERNTAPVSLSGPAPAWTARAQRNNPCPPGWRIPSMHDFWDIYRGDGIDTNAFTGDYITTDKNNNHWRWHERNSDNSQSHLTNIAGGAIIERIDTGEQVFLPAIGLRSGNTAAVTISNGIFSEYWSSTQMSTGSARSLRVAAGGIQIANVSGAANLIWSSALSVRCVQ